MFVDLAAFYAGYYFYLLVFKTSILIFLCPTIFSLSELDHFLKSIYCVLGEAKLNTTSFYLELNTRLVLIISSFPIF